MPTPVQKLVPLLLRPSGMPKNMRPTPQAVEKYKAREPNPLKRLPLLTYGGASLIAASVPLAMKFTKANDILGKIVTAVAGFLGITSLFASILPDLGYNIFYGASSPQEPDQGGNTIPDRRPVRVDEFLYGHQLPDAAYAGYAPLAEAG